MSFELTYLAFQRHLPPTEKLLLIYLSNHGPTPQKWNPVRAAEFCSRKVARMEKALTVLLARGYIHKLADGNIQVQPQEIPF